VIFPNGDLDRIERFRQTWDPLSTSVPAHITLVFPVDEPVPEDELQRDFDALFSASPEFAVTATTVQPWEDEYLFLVLDQGADQVCGLHDALYRGPFSAVTRPSHFLPHMTVGRTDPSRLPSAVADAEQQGLALRADVSTISVYRIEDGGQRVETLRYRLPGRR
jgi:2'-5' RNA ligase